jgi:hypothetical protein
LLVGQRPYDVCSKFYERADSLIILHSAKIKLLASFREQIEEHNMSLSEREKNLASVKGKLLQEGENILNRPVADKV